MRSIHYSMTASDIYRYAAAMLESKLQWHDRGPKCTVTVLFQVLFYAAMLPCCHAAMLPCCHAAMQLCSVFAACTRLKTAPSDQALRDALTLLLIPVTACLTRIILWTR